MALVLTQTIAATSPASASTAATAAVPLEQYVGSELVVLASLVGATGGTLDVYIQETWDVDKNGQLLAAPTWRDVCHFTQLTAGATAIKYRVAIQPDSTVQTIGTGTTAAPGVALAAGKVCGGPWGPMVRLVFVAGASTTAGAAISVSFSQRVDNEGH